MCIHAHLHTQDLSLKANSCFVLFCFVSVSQEEQEGRFPPAITAWLLPGSSWQQKPQGFAHGSWHVDPAAAVGSKGEVCIWAPSHLSFITARRPRDQGNHSRVQLAGSPHWPGTSLSCQERSPTPTKQENPTHSTQLSGRHRDLNLFCVCQKKEECGVLSNIRSWTPTHTQAHSMVPQTLPYTYQSQLIYGTGGGGWGGVAKTVPAILELSERDKILASLAEEGVKTGKRLLCKCDERSVSHRIHQERKSQMW